MFNKFVISAATVLTTLSACAQTKQTTAIQSGKTYAKVIDADMQRTLPGMRGAEPTTDYHIIIVWTSKIKPEAFFWRGESGWMACNVSKVHKIKGRKPGTKDMQPWYTAETISLTKVKRGDTLEILPVMEGKYPTPAEIPSSATNTLFLKAAKTKWLSLPVTNIIRKQDVPMP